MSEKLKPRPFCGNEDVGTIGNSPAYVYCRICGAHSDKFLSKSVAKTQWNRRASEWIKTSERLPELETDVFVFNGKSYAVGYSGCSVGFLYIRYDGKMEWVVDSEMACCDVEDFPYWMPLPGPPEVEE